MNIIPAIVAGPMLRHCHRQQITLWLVTTQPFQFSCQLIGLNENMDEQSILLDRLVTQDELIQTQIGKRAFINHITIRPEQAIPIDTLIEYDLQLINGDAFLTLSDQVSGIAYPDKCRPNFVLKPQLNNVLHGSCRKPHFDAEDGLLRVDQLIAEQGTSVENRPSLLMMSGDQVYADDVAGPMLSAIHQVIDLLGLYNEEWDAGEKNHDAMTNNAELFRHPNGYYQRHLILPADRVNKSWLDHVFADSKKPIFTSVNAKNHLVTLSEVLAQYLLVWSPTLWEFVNIEDTSRVPGDCVDLYLKELNVIQQFAATLPQVRRALAHIPVYMIFDDHDVTDDWNLTRGWEEAAYEHPFSKRIIGNALAGYYLCQGLGNNVDLLAPLSEKILPCFTSSHVQQHDMLIDELLNWDHWHYHLDTQPKMVVLDTRTQRWRSESNANKPSGLMDWECLSALQQELINQPAVIMVSPAPIYGVKLIEAVQRVFTFFGKPLAVDAENWMAHSGTANVMLNIFRHYKTPPNFIILSGDVHYSFVYDVTHRFRRNSSRIIQITCSGIKNEFPEGLITWLERLNRYLYGRYSPLNFFTKRRRMRIRIRRPDKAPSKTLYNGSGIGLVKLSNNGEDVTTELLVAKNDVVTFISKDDIDDNEDS